jgi:hypothetical protein
VLRVVQPVIYTQGLGASKSPNNMVQLYNTIFAAAVDAASDSPGPASYAVPASIPSGPCYSMGARFADKDAAAAAGCDGPAVGDYDVADAAGMAVSGPAWTMGGRIAAAGEGRDAAELPGGQQCTCVPD